MKCMKIICLVMTVGFQILICQTELFPGGIYFNGAANIQDTSYLDLTSSAPLVIKKPFLISFELSIWNRDKHGIVFESEDSTMFIRLVYNNFTSNDTSYFELINSRSKKSLVVPIVKNELYSSRWHVFSVWMDPGNGSFAIQIDSQAVQKGTYPRLALNYSPRIIFGKFEDPEMSVRNIRLYQEGELTNHYPLYENEGRTVHDIIGQNNAVQNNLEWLSPQHYHWNLENVFPVRRYYPLKNDSSYFESEPLVD
jgi:hypothetical protein